MSDPLPTDGLSALEIERLDVTAEQVQRLLGHVKIGKSCYIGANSTILPTINIGNNAIVGAGAVVIRDVEENSTYAGVPAKRIK